MLIVVTVNVYSDQNDKQRLFAIIISQIKVDNSKLPFTPPVRAITVRSGDVLNDQKISTRCPKTKIMKANTSSVIANTCKVLNLSPIISLQSSISIGVVEFNLTVLLATAVVDA